VAIDYTRTKFENVAKDVDVVLDTVGRDTLERSYGAVKKGGIIVSIVDEPKSAALEAHGIRGVTLRCTPKAGVLEELSKLMEAKKRSEEHTSELQSPCNLVCRLLLEKKKIHFFSKLSGSYRLDLRYTKKHMMYEGKVE